MSRTTFFQTISFGLGLLLLTLRLDRYIFASYYWDVHAPARFILVYAIFDFVPNEEFFRLA